MALNSGFPASNTISPSIRIVEQDLSFVPSEVTLNNAGIVGFASKGPINIPTQVNTVRELHLTFGFPHPSTSDPYLIYAGEQYLSTGNVLWVVRVADTSPSSSTQATTASVEIPSAGSSAIIVGNTTATYDFASDTFFRWRLNGILSPKILVVLSTTHRPSPNAGVPYSLADLVSTLNAQLTAQDGITFVASATNTLEVKTTFSYGPDASIELVSVKSALYGPVLGVDGTTRFLTSGTPTAGLGVNMSPAATVGSLDRYPNNSYTSAGTYDFTGLSSVNLLVVVDGTGSSTIDNVVQTVVLSATSYTTNTLVDAINNYITASLPGGFFAYRVGNNIALSTYHSGKDAKLLVKADSTADTLMGLTNLTSVGTSPSGATGDADTYADGIVVGTDDLSGTNTFQLTADSEGIEGNNTQVIITNSVREGTFSIDVYSNGNQVEHFGSLSKTESDTYYVESYLALVSNFIRAVDNTLATNLPKPGTYSLTGGTDGIPTSADDQDTLILGSDVANTGLQALSDSEQIDIDMVAVPGHSSTSVIDGIINFVQNNRQDCIAIIDPPFGLTVNEVVAWQNGTHPLNNERFDSDFCALYWPWVKTYDTTNRINVWVPPSGSVMATYVRSDALAAPWYAPAGIQRGIVPNVVDVYTKPSLDERDLMQGNRNAVNPIVSFVGTTGFMLWGQKTMQRTPTALDRVNVRRMMFYIEKRIKQDCRNLLFEPHDEILRQRFISIAKDTLDHVKSNRGLNDYIIKCDTELNTPDVIDRNELRAQIGVQPTHAAEFIFITFSINRTGSFTTSDTGTGS